MSPSWPSRSRSINWLRWLPNPSIRCLLVRTPIPCYSRRFALNQPARLAHLPCALHLFSGSEAPACRQGVSAVSSLEWYTGGVLRHAACEQSARCDSPWKTEPGGVLAGNGASGNTLGPPDGVTPLLPTPAPEAAHAAGRRSRRAAVLQPDPPALSFRGKWTPLA